MFHCVHFECFEDDQSAIESDKPQGQGVVPASPTTSSDPNSASGSGSSNDSSPKNLPEATGDRHEDTNSSPNRQNSGQWPPGYDQAAGLSSPELPGQVPQLRRGHSNSSTGSSNGAVARPLARPTNAMDHFYLPQADPEGPSENRERAPQGLGAVSRQRPILKDLDPLV